MGIGGMEAEALLSQRKPIQTGELPHPRLPHRTSRNQSGGEHVASIQLNDGGDRTNTHGADAKELLAMEKYQGYTPVQMMAQLRKNSLAHSSAALGSSHTQPPSAVSGDASNTASTLKAASLPAAGIGNSAARRQAIRHILEQRKRSGKSLSGGFSADCFKKPAGFGVGKNGDSASVAATVGNVQKFLSEARLRTEGLNSESGEAVQAQGGNSHGKDFYRSVSSPAASEVSGTGGMTGLSLNGLASSLPSVCHNSLQEVPSFTAVPSSDSFSSGCESDSQPGPSSKESAKMNHTMNASSSKQVEYSYVKNTSPVQRDGQQESSETVRSKQVIRNGNHDTTSGETGERKATPPRGEEGGTYQDSTQECVSQTDTTGRNLSSETVPSLAAGRNNCSGRQDRPHRSEQCPVPVNYCKLQLVNQTTGQNYSVTLVASDMSNLLNICTLLTNEVDARMVGFGNTTEDLVDEMSRQIGMPLAMVKLHAMPAGGHYSAQQLIELSASHLARQAPPDWDQLIHKFEREGIEGVLLRHKEVKCFDPTDHRLPDGDQTYRTSDTVRGRDRSPSRDSQPQPRRSFELDREPRTLLQRCRSYEADQTAQECRNFGAEAEEEWVLSAQRSVSDADNYTAYSDDCSDDW